MIVSDDELRAEFKQLTGTVVSDDDMTRTRTMVESDLAASYPNCSSDELKPACFYLIMTRILSALRARGSSQADEGVYLRLYELELPKLKRLDTQRANKKTIESPPTNNYTLTMKDKVKKGSYYG